MNISLQKFSKDDLIDFLSFFGHSFLLKPIVGNTRYFNKAPNTKKWIDGYRITNLPAKNVYKIYVSEIISRADTPLEQWLLSDLNRYFEDIKVEEIINDKALDDFTKALRVQAAVTIKPLIGKDKKRISAVQVLKLFGIDLDATSLKIFKTVSQVLSDVVEAFRHQQIQKVISCKEKADTVIKDLKKQVDKLTEECRIHKNKAVKCEAKIGKLHDQLEESEQKVHAVTTMVDEFNLDQMRIKAVEKELQQLKKQKVDVENKIQQKEENGESQVHILQNDVNEVQRRLQELNDQEKQEIGKLSALKAQIAEMKKTREDLKDELSKRERISVEIEKRVKDKLQDTEECIAEFFANYSLYANPRLQNATPMVAEICKKSIVKGVRVDDDPYEVMNEIDLLECLKDNLDEAGVMKGYHEMLAAYLLAAHYKRMPLILAGANAEDIAEAVAVTLYNKTANRMNCTNGTSTSFKSEPGGITMLYDAIGTRNMKSILHACAEGDGYYYYVADSAEELFVESKGLFNYAIPLFTDFFVDKRGSSMWTGCSCNLKLNTLVSEKVQISIPQYALSPLAFNICYDLMAQYTEFRKNYRPYDGFILQTLPIMMILGKTEDLVDLINNGKLSDNDKEHLLMLCGEK